MAKKPEKVRRNAVELAMLLGSAEYEDVRRMQEALRRQVERDAREKNLILGVEDERTEYQKMVDRNNMTMKA